jgi:hypothetical protein
MSDGFVAGVRGDNLAVTATGGVNDLLGLHSSPSDEKGNRVYEDKMCGAALYLLVEWMGERGVNYDHQRSRFILDTLKEVLHHCVMCAIVNSAKVSHILCGDHCTQTRSSEFCDSIQLTIAVAARNCTCGMLFKPGTQVMRMSAMFAPKYTPGLGLD